MCDPSMSQRIIGGETAKDDEVCMYNDHVVGFHGICCFGLCMFLISKDTDYLIDV